MFAITEGKSIDAVAVKSRVASAVRIQLKENAVACISQLFFARQEDFSIGAKQDCGKPIIVLPKSSTILPAVPKVASSVPFDKKRTTPAAKL